MCATQAEADEAVLRSSFNRLDVNGDKFVTMDEILGSLTKSEDSFHRVKQTQGFMTQIQNFINDNDSNSDKKLDEEEFVKAMKKFAV